MSLKLSAFIVAVVTAAVLSAPSDARADYAFCAAWSSATRCDYQTYEQCQVAVSGIGVDCIANPAGALAQATQLPVKRLRRDQRR